MKEMDLSRLRTIGEFIKKHYIILLLIIPIFFSIFFRVYTVELPITDTWAKDSVNNYYKQSFAQQINAQYPNLPDEAKNRLLIQQVDKYMLDNKETIDSQIKDASSTFKKALQDSSGFTYLLEMDPYVFYMGTKNMLEKGYYYDTIKDGQPYDWHVHAPTGKIVSDRPHGHIWFEYFLVKFVRLFNKDAEIFHIIFFAPVIIAALAIIPAFFIVRKIAGNFGGLFAAMIIAIHPVFLARTPAGFSDTDVYTIFFPLMIIWFFFMALETDSWKKKLIFGTVSAFFIGLYSIFWISWMIFIIVAATSVIYLFVYLIFNYKKFINAADGKVNNFIELIKANEFKWNAILLILIIVVSTGATFVFNRSNLITDSLTIPLSSMKGLKSATKTDYWPNVFTTVAEMNSSSFMQIMNDIGMSGASGGKLLFFMSIGGIVILFLRKKEQDYKVNIMLIIWYLITIYSSIKGVRFILLLVPAFAVALGVFIGLAVKYIAQLAKSSLNLESKWVTPFVMIMFCLLLITPLSMADRTARSEIPLIDDTWYNGLIQIKQQSQQTAIITSWWDFGHWFKAIADRGVTFDGGSQNSHASHWVGKMLLTNDENLAIGLLRMTNCGESEAFDYINNNITDEDIDESIALIYNIVRVNKTEAYNILKQHGVNDIDTSAILKKSHCVPPEAFFITSEDMIGKSGVWAHFGSWNFSKSQMYINVKGKEYIEGVDYLKNHFSFNDQQAQDYYYKIQGLDTESGANDWIAPWPSYMSDISACQPEPSDKNLIICSNGLIFNLTSSGAFINTAQGQLKVRNIGFISNGTFILNNYPVDKTAEVGAIMLPGGQSVLTHPDLTGSMFTRLFYLNGVGLKHFEKFYDQQGVLGQKVIIWKVKW
jgi:dolichyl-phosphooligosaccharide-protein glycotransferase